MKCIHQVILVFDDHLLVVLQGLCLPLIQGDLFEPTSLSSRHSWQALSRFDHAIKAFQVEHDAFVTGKWHRSLNHATLVILKALENKAGTTLESSHLSVDVELSDCGQANVLIRVWV